ncbi:hypothetical protein PAXRUDRAFT_14347 [Paxillus rubicundulus Ve08.2h10]|uniref:Uncharacterized protein n=1 Tax=Paxillus rubicundulus Ve08.2h10 TaxID=930991 RepID=A0A0D0DHV4_9AGAM|nr:hypothetical protein PAXRUDRAFT_14347 [Paxillus rubicundulus Ve08.2h10]
MSGSSAGLISVAATFARYLLSNDCELATVSEESGLTYQDDFEYFFELLSNPAKQEWALEVMNFVNKGVWNKPHQPSANAALHTSAAAETPSWESDILAQLNGPLTQSQQHTPPHNPRHNSELMDTADGGGVPSVVPRGATLAPASFIISQAQSVTSALIVEVGNLSLGLALGPTQPSISARRTRELSAAARHGGRAETTPAVASEEQTLGPTKGRQNPPRTRKATRLSR